MAPGGSSQPADDIEDAKAHEGGGRPPYARPYARIAGAIEGLFTVRRLGAVAVISLAGFLLIVNSSWIATPDSALYVALGESLARGDGYVFNGEPHTHVPPGYPMIVSRAARVLGANFLSYRIVMAFLGALTAVFGFLLIWRLAGRDAALLLGGACALNHVLLHNSTLTISDVPFALFCLIALHVLLFAGERKDRILWAVLAGFTIGLLPLIRINGLGFAPAAAVFLLFSWKDMRLRARLFWVAVFLLWALAPFGLWQLWKSSLPHSDAEGSYLNLVTGRTLQGQVWMIVTTLWGYVQETSYVITGLVLRTGVLEWIAPGVAVAGAVRACREGDRLLVPLAVIEYCGLLLSPAGSRYLIFLVPALYLFFALGILEVGGRLSRRVAACKNPGRLLVWCFVLVSVVNVGHNMKTIYQCRTALEAYGAQSERGLPFFVAARWLKTNAPGVPILTARPRIIHYLSGCPTIPLIRFGVPEQEHLVTSEKTIGEMMTARKPQFLFTDEKIADLNDRVESVLKMLGYRLDEIPAARCSDRYRLYRLVSREARPQEAQ